MSNNADSTSLNKFLAEAGLCSRREADRWIEAGRVQLNGQTARRGNRVELGDIVLLDGKPITRVRAQVYLMLNKPPGITCTTDRRDRDNVIEYIDYPERIFPIGRLDKPSTGLLLLTNDGDVVNNILRAEYGHEKEYIVTVNKDLTPDFISGMAGGVPILDTVTNPCEVEAINDRTFRIILTQGLNRQIRRMCEHFGYRVRTLKRVRIMSLRLGDLPTGRWRELTPQEKNELSQELNYQLGN